MKVAILIQCHNHIENLNHLIQFFFDDFFDIFIHLDKKSDLIDNIKLNKNVYLIKNRISVKWGQFSQVEASLELLKEAMKTYDYKYVNLISGVDVPVKSIDYMKKFFEANNNQYIECSKLPNGWSKGGLDRIKVFYPQWMISRPTDKIRRAVRILYREFILGTKIFERDTRLIKTFYGGSQWFSITGECANYLLKEIETHLQKLEFFRNVLCSDELIFNTLIMNSPFKNKVKNNNLRYIDWHQGYLGSPKDLDIEDINSAVKSKKIFARKVSSIEVMEDVYLKIK